MPFFSLSLPNCEQSCCILSCSAMASFNNQLSQNKKETDEFSHEKLAFWQTSGFGPLRRNPPWTF
jgi:hypothetical protein